MNESGKRIGLALGGGGARGLAHIPILEVFDELGVRPHYVAGTSIGAIMGALYCSGLSAEQIKEAVGELVITKKSKLREVFRKKVFLNIVKLFDPAFGTSGLIKGEKFVSYLHEKMKVSTFEQLEIPLKVVAADFWKREQVVFESGELLSPLKASMALPSIFKPVVLDGRVLIDGGVVNPVPYDLLLDVADITVAVDVIGVSSGEAGSVPSVFDEIPDTIEIMQQSILDEKMKRRRPDIYIKPRIANVGLLHFHKADEIYEQGRLLTEQLKRELELAIA